MTRSWVGMALVVAGLTAAAQAQNPLPKPAETPGTSPPTIATTPPSSYPAETPVAGEPVPQTVSDFDGPGAFDPYGVYNPDGRTGPLRGAVPPSDPNFYYRPENAFAGPETQPGPSMLSANLEYLFWWVKKQELPILATTGPLDAPVAGSVPGALSSTGTRSLIDNNFDNSYFQGGRLGVTALLTSDQALSVTGRFYILETKTAFVTSAGDGSPTSSLITRPFFNPNTRSEDADPVNVPGAIAGRLQVATPRRFHGADANLRVNVLNSGATGSNINFLVGGRYLSLDEKLGFTESLSDVPGLTGPLFTYNLSEQFTTYNRFWGGQVGSEWSTCVGPFIVQCAASVAVGSTNEVVQTTGFSQASSGGQTFARNSALLVQPTNLGRFTNSELAFVPEASVNVAWQANEYVSLYAGYTFLYWSRVARPGDQIDRVVNIQPINTNDVFDPRRPGPLTNSSDFWAQGLSFGLQINY